MKPDDQSPSHREMEYRTTARVLRAHRQAAVALPLLVPLVDVLEAFQAEHSLITALNRHPLPDWVHQQVYLHSYPRELMLRNHVQV